MLRLTEIYLPIDHPPEALPAAVHKRLRTKPEEVAHIRVFRRGLDARRPGAMAFVYTVDVEILDEPGLLTKLKGADGKKPLKHLGPAPDMAYRFVAKAPEKLASRPIVGEYASRREARYVRRTRRTCVETSQIWKPSRRSISGSV